MKSQRVRLGTLGNKTPAPLTRSMFRVHLVLVLAATDLFLIRHLIACTTKVVEDRRREGEGKAGGRKLPAFKGTNEAAAAAPRAPDGSCAAPQGCCLRALPLGAHLRPRLDQGWEQSPCPHALLPPIGRNGLSLTPIPERSRVSGRACDFQPQPLGACRCHCAMMRVLQAAPC